MTFCSSTFRFVSLRFLYCKYEYSFCGKEFSYCKYQVINFPFILVTDMSDACVGSPIYQCVDKMGVVRTDGETWSPSPCTECECRDGRIICRTLFIDCQPPPHPGCVAMPGPCCPVYHCDEYVHS